MADPLRILYLAVYDPHVPYTGTGARGGEVVNFFAGRAHVDLVYMEGSGHPGDPRLEAEFANRLRGVKSKIRVPFTRRGYFLFSRELLQAAANLLKEGPYDVIFADYGLAARYGAVLSRRFGVPFIYSSHNIEYRQYLGKAGKDPRRWPLIPYVYCVERKGCTKAVMVVAISPEEADVYTKWIPGEKIVVVPQGFDAAVFHPDYPPPENDPKIVLFFGNYRISTNVDAVRVMRDRIADEIVREFPNVTFQFVGASPPVELKHPRFEFTGFVDSVVPYLRRADVVISPMLGGWGMPTKIIEALACGKPVVASPVGARSVPRHYKRLTVTGLDGFSGEVVRALKQNRPVDAVDFPALKKDFLWENRLAELWERMKAVLSASGAGAGGD
jgi:glycosyltransferase involved in cell wall biosynthesis